jgi:cytochrome P450
MTTLADLDLPYLPLDEPGFSLDPMARFADARRHHPWLARWKFTYVVTDARAVRELIMANDGKTKVAFGHVVDMMGAAGTPWGDFVIGSVQVQSGEPHKRLRTVLASSFTPREANRHRALMREVMASLLDEWAPKGRFDFEEFISYFPISVMCRIIGVSPAIVPDIRSSLDVLGNGGTLDPSYLPTLQANFLRVDGYVHELVARRRSLSSRSEAPDLLDQLLRTVGEGGMSDAELYNLLVFLFAAGYDTSKNVLTHLMDLMLERPGIYERCASDPEFCRKVVDETLRYRGVASAPRLVLAPFEFRGLQVPEGTILFIPWGMVGRDTNSFEAADVFEPQRAKSAAMPFGLGPHMCLGQHIARAQIEEGLHLMAQRILRPRRTGPSQWRDFPGVWGLRGLPIEFDAPTAHGVDAVT